MSAPEPVDPGLEYPWNGGTWLTVNNAEIFAPDGDEIDEWIVGLGDYVDEGAPDLLVRLHRDTPRRVVEWVAIALETAAWMPAAVADIDGDET